MRTVIGLSWCYLILLVSAWGLLRLAGDRWWLATVLIFGPRLLLGPPLLILLPAAVWLHRRSIGPLLASLVVLVGPILGFCLPLARPARTNEPELRVLTYNIAGNRVDGERLIALVRDVRADVVMLQECAGNLDIRWPETWHVQKAGQLVLASRYPLSAIDIAQRADPPSPWPPINGIHARLAMPGGSIGVCCVHLMTPREGLSEVLDRHTVVSSWRSDKLTAEISTRQRESQSLSEWIRQFEGPLIIAGDFNMPADSRIFQSYWTRWQDAFSSVGFGFGYTKYEPLFGLAYGARIDHVLTSDWARPLNCRVGPDLGSDHRPIIAEVEVDLPDATENRSPNEVTSQGSTQQ